MTPKRRLFWQLFPSYLLITLLSLVAVTWYASSAIKQFYIEHTVDDLEAHSRLFEEQISGQIDPLDAKAIDLLSKKAGKAASTRITVMLPSGKVVGDSNEDPATMDNHRDRPEFIGAIRGNCGTSLRHSITLDKDLMYLAIPLKKGGHTVAVVRASIPISAIDDALKIIQVKIFLGGLVMALFAAILSFWVSRRITRPIEQIRKWAESIARGDYLRKPSIRSSEEIEGLCDALNRMAEDLRERIDLVIRQRNEMKAVFSSMMEGVIAFDMKEHIISLNQAAADILRCDLTAARGKSMQEVVRNTALHEFVKEALLARGAIEKDIPVALSGGEGLVNGHGAMLRDAGGKRIGVLLVLNDVTRLRRLENIRSDFVSNVSHEIKTPITAIKGFVETLRDGAITNPVDAKRFLGIIEKHVDRLEAIIEDLLHLSRIEETSEKEGLAFVESRMKEILQNALQVCHVNAADKKINVEISCAESIVERVDPSLLEQAIVNLLDNAIKYSDDGGGIKIEAIQREASIVIAVSDQGCGINKEHLPRLFERFYRVDKARSRQLGGTGLGLAIVKHIVQAHGGHISVESTPGKGTTFFIHLPVW
ncbi:MAG: PAS domain-containing protein [Deltaproteobacteria bacterium]|nr:PAS domain-containing protein [Deltaproteobacteria bacterium]